MLLKIRTTHLKEQGEWWSTTNSWIQVILELWTWGTSDFKIMEHPFLFSNDFDSWDFFCTSCGQWERLQSRYRIKCLRRYKSNVAHWYIDLDMNLSSVFFVSDFANAEGFTSDQCESHTTKSVAHAPGTLWRWGFDSMVYWGGWESQSMSKSLITGDWCKHTVQYPIYNMNTIWLTSQ